MVEASEVHRTGRAEVEQHGARTDGERVRIETLTEDENAGVLPHRFVEDLIGAIACAEDVRVLADPTRQDVVAGSANKYVVTAVALQDVVARAAVQKIATLA